MTHATTLCRWLAAAALLGLCGAEPAPSPYAGEQGRPIKSLSESQIEGYENGQGMGFAKAAELNSYPGPMHVLELAEELKLTPPQRAEAKKAFDAMKAEAVKLGRRLVELERELDAAFASGKADETVVDRLTSEIGGVQGRLRAVHLKAHLRMKKALSDEQVRAYDAARGYAEPPARPAGGGSGSRGGS